MRARQQSNNGKRKAEYKSIAVKVDKFFTVKDEHDNTQTGVSGTNLLNGKTEHFFMTVPKNEEKAADYKNRPSLEKWAGVFKEFGITKEVLPGAVLHFKNCIPFDKKEDPMGKHYKAIWVDRLGDNPQDVQDCLVRGCMVVEGFYDWNDKIGENGIPETKEDGSPIKYSTLTGGRAFSFETRPDHFIKGTIGPELERQLQQALASKNNPQLLIRYMNEDGQVCCDTFGSKSWVKDDENNFVKRSPEEATALWSKELKAVMITLPDAKSVDIIPAEAFSLSKEAISKGTRARAFKAVDFACTHYGEDKTKLKNMQLCFGKCSSDADYSHILNKLDCVEKGDKANPAKDPTLLGNLEYSPNYGANVVIADTMLHSETDPANAETDSENFNQEQPFEDEGMSPSYSAGHMT
ncbi:MAG: hypothetical protein GY710_15285 [Desulfobacteraceae bacterium]|nr:hypothetical protein [Desulfobacteraceae bacterium]